MHPSRKRPSPRPRWGPHTTGMLSTTPQATPEQMRHHSRKSVDALKDDLEVSRLCERRGCVCMVQRMSIITHLIVVDALKDDLVVACVNSDHRYAYIVQR